jgi:hypothetical protein
MLGRDPAPRDAARTDVPVVDLGEQVERCLAAGTLGAQSGERQLVGLHRIADREHALEVGIGRRGPDRRAHADRIGSRRQPGRVGVRRWPGRSPVLDSPSSGRGAVW